MKTNQFTLTGNIGQDVKVNKFAASSKASFNLAVHKTNKESETTSTEWFSIEAWRKNEDVNAFENLKKGQFVTVNGYIKHDRFTDNEGNDHDRLVLVATDWEPVARKEKVKKGE